MSFQITTDGFAPYRSAITNTLEDRCDFAQLIKVYRASVEGDAGCSPAEVAEVVEVQPWAVLTDLYLQLQLSSAAISAAYGHSSLHETNECVLKEMGGASVALWFGFYNFCRIHKSLRVTQAMEVGIKNHPWSIRELLQAA